MRTLSGRLFLDMDGVLADFDAHHAAVFGFRSSRELDNVNWNEVRKVRDFYRDIPPMADLRELWDFVKQFNPTILTGIPSSIAEEAALNKRAWVDRHLGRHVPVITCPSRLKCLHAQHGDILVDDWEKYRTKWEEVGGVWITHTSAASTIAALTQKGT